MRPPARRQQQCPSLGTCRMLSRPIRTVLEIDSTSGSAFYHHMAKTCATSARSTFITEVPAKSSPRSLFYLLKTWINTKRECLLMIVGASAPTVSFCSQYTSEALLILSLQMKFFNWMQNKFNGGQGNRKPTPASSTYNRKQEHPKEEFSDWPHGLLAIGTFGNHDLKGNPERTQNLHQDDPSSSDDDLSDFTPEEVGQLQKELTKLLRRKPASKAEGENADLPLDRFLNCPSSLEVDRRISTTVCSDSDDKEEEIDRTIRVIIDRCKDVCMEKNKKAIGKKSISFLLKKMFVCRSGFVPAPSLRDTLQESRMEKLLRTMLSKKKYPQNSSRASSVKKYLEDRKTPKNKEEETQEKAKEGCKWVKTDSEYIVLEI